MREKINKRIVKRYTLIKINTQNVDDEVCVNLTYGSIGGYWDCKSYPKEIFDSEDEAMEYMLKEELYGNYMFVPVFELEYDYE